MIDENDTPFEDDYTAYLNLCVAVAVEPMSMEDNWLEHMLDLEFSSALNEIDDWEYEDDGLYC